MVETYMLYIHNLEHTFKMCGPGFMYVSSSSHHLGDTMIHTPTAQNYKLQWTLKIIWVNKTEITQRNSESETREEIVGNPTLLV